MDQAIIKLIEHAPQSVAILAAVYMMLRHFATQKTECHEWQEKQSASTRELCDKLNNTLSETNKIVAQCSVGYQRCERAYHKLLERGEIDDESNDKMR
jgi:hypothetical protein